MPVLLVGARAIRTPARANAQRRLRETIDARTRAGAEQVRVILRATVADMTDAELAAAIRSGQAAGLLPPGSTERVLQDLLEQGARAGMGVESELARDERVAEAIRGVAARPTLPDLTADWMRDRGARLVTEVEEPARDAIRRTVAAGLRRGEPPEAIAPRLRAVAGIHSRQAEAIERVAAGMAKGGASPEAIERTRARLADEALTRRTRTIAQTESTAAVDQGRRGLWKDLIGEKFVDGDSVRQFWLTRRDDRVEERCRALEGREAEGMDGKFPGGARPPLHVNCLPGDQLVAPVGTLRAVSRRWFEGEVVVLRVAGDEDVAFTPNHPVLTEHGWVPARRAHEAGHVLCLRDGGRSLGGPDDGYVPTRIEEVARSFLVDSRAVAHEVSNSVPDFHGDGREGGVAVVLADRELWRAGEPTLGEQIEKALLSLRHRLSAAVVGGLDQLVERAHAAAGGVVGGPGLRLALAGGHAAPLHAFGVGLAAELDARPGKHAPNDVAGNAERERDGILRLARLVAVDHAGLVDRDSALGRAAGSRPARDAGPDEMVVDGRNVSPNSPRDFLERHAGLIERRDLLSVGSHGFSGFVYTLETSEGAFIAGRSRIVNENCRCVIAYEGKFA